MLFSQLIYKAQEKVISLALQLTCLFKIMTFACTFHPIIMWIMVSAMLLLSMHHCLVIASSSDIWSATHMDLLAFVRDVEQATFALQMKHTKCSTQCKQDAIEASQ
jgi:hypothetical protein